MKYILLLLLYLPLNAQPIVFLDTLILSDPMQISLNVVLNKVGQVDYLVLNSQIHDTLFYNLPIEIGVSAELNELSSSVSTSGPKSYIYISSYLNNGLVAMIEWRRMFARMSEKDQQLKLHSAEVFNFTYNQGLNGWSTGVGVSQSIQRHRRK